MCWHSKLFSYVFPANKLTKPRWKVLYKYLYKKNYDLPCWLCDQHDSSRLNLQNICMVPLAKYKAVTGVGAVALVMVVYCNVLFGKINAVFTVGVRFRK
jgi:hypothetical protein